ncbi:MAG: aminotransferase [Clostridia bacterium]|nr:aminotransferase [Clostridia bacterium]
MRYDQLSKEALVNEYNKVQEEYQSLNRLGLKLNLSRGKPDSDQLRLSHKMLHTLDDEDYDMDGVDTRNYGELLGLPSCRALFADILGTKPEEVMVGGCASLNLMYDLIAKAYTHGLLHSPEPWSKLETVKWLCPFPGYDRHFNVSKSFGMELIPIPLKEDGPDMDLVEQYAKDPAVKGIWCVPKYSNPDGYIYSEAVCNRLATLEYAAPDFTIMWDNAYCVHTFEGEDPDFPDMLSICREAGNPDIVYEFASTSKITFPGSGVSCMATSVENLKYVESLLTYQIISYNKVNQLMHVRFLKDKEHTLQLMAKHASILRPKFDVVLEALDEEIAPLGIATWNKPKGGYFVSLNALPGTAKRTLALCKACGVVMTGAGATYPGGVDPVDSNIRIAPTYPPMRELKQAIKVFCTCLKMAALEQYID